MNGTGPTGLRRVLGLGDATCVVVGAIIGVGIFFTPSLVAETAGSITLALLVWVLGGVVALLGALTFAELGRLYPRAGGQYDILRDAYGPLVAFVYVFCNLTAIQAGSSAVIGIICAKNLLTAVGAQQPGGLWVLALALALIWGLAISNALGVRFGAAIQNITVYAKLLTLVAVMALAALARGTPPAEAPPAPSPAPGILTALFAGLIPALFSYGGWQQALWMGGEVKDAERNLPRAIIGGVVIVVIVYVGAAWAYFALLGYEGVRASRELAAEAVGTVWPGFGETAVALAVAFSAFGVLNAQFLTGPRLTYAMARDGRFFPPFAGVSPRFGTPLAAILLLAALATGLLLVSGADGELDLTAWVVVIDALFFTLTGFSLLVLVRTGRVPPVRSRALLGAAALFGLLELAAVYGAVLDEQVRKAAVYGFCWIALSVLIYFVRFRDGVRAPGIRGS